MNTFVYTMNPMQVQEFIKMAKENVRLSEVIKHRDAELARIQSLYEKEKEMSDRQFVALVELNNKVNVLQVENNALRTRLNSSNNNKNVNKLLEEKERQKEVINTLNNRLQETVKIESELPVERVLLSQINDIKQVIIQKKDYNLDPLIDSSLHYIKKADLELDRLPYERSLTGHQLITVTKRLENINLNFIEAVKSITSLFCSISYILVAGNVLRIYSLLTKNPSNNHINSIISNMFAMVSIQRGNIIKVRVSYINLFHKLINKLLKIDYLLNPNVYSNVTSRDYVNALEFEAINNIEPFNVDELIKVALEQQ